MLPASPSSVFHTKFTTLDLKTNKHSILTAIELEPPTSESSTWTAKYHASTASEQKFCKKGIQNWPLIGIEVKLS